jgi:hypothetical protein
LVKALWVVRNSTSSSRRSPQRAAAASDARVPAVRVEVVPPGPRQPRGSPRPGGPAEAGTPTRRSAGRLCVGARCERSAGRVAVRCECAHAHRFRHAHVNHAEAWESSIRSSADAFGRYPTARNDHHSNSDRGTLRLLPSCVPSRRTRRGARARVGRVRGRHRREDQGRSCCDRSICSRFCRGRAGPGWAGREAGSGHFPAGGCRTGPHARPTSGRRLWGPDARPGAAGRNARRLHRDRSSPRSPRDR